MGAARTRRALDRYGFLRAMRRLGWADAHLVVAEAYLPRLVGMVPLGDERVLSGHLVMGFPRCSSVHTWFMSRAVDVAFIDGDGEPIRLVSGVPPWRVVSCPGAAGVLERFSAGGAGGE